MGRPPAYLFVVRHGYRLDAADKQWHLSSPTPYDPPLTYSGWQQAKSLGVRIASILRDRIQADELEATLNPGPTGNRKRKRYEVVLHSSPFLRCVQTSIAISAGLAQDGSPFGPSKPRPPPPNSATTSDDRPRPTVDTGAGAPATPAATSANITKSILRLDAFLGEWLSPSYFELITPPPESVMMLASAKADLLRREDYTHHHASFVSHNHSNSQGQLWSPVARPSPGSPPDEARSDVFSPASSLASSPPASSTPSSARSDQQAQPPRPAGYVSPVPHYAVSNNKTIPPGYVSHARDACVMIDYQWQSTRSAVDWGDGGTFPEEWAAMHKRFRAGVQSLTDWYSTAENPTKPVTKTARTKPEDDVPEIEDDVETETVVILVSHGAGCNALIGAITHQPVLMDVSMASLTMAVRKPSVDEPTAQVTPDTPPPIHHLYDLKLFANTDHLRSPTDTPTASSPAASALNGLRGRHSSFSTSVSSFSWNDPSARSRNSSASASLTGGFRRSPLNNDATTIPRLSFASSSGAGGITVGSGVTSFTATRASTLGRAGTGGLWSPLSAKFEDDEDDDDDDYSIPVLNFGFEKLVTAKTATPSESPAPQAETKTPASNGSGPTAVNEASVAGLAGERSPRPDPEQLGAGAGGLWGIPRPPDEADRLRDLTGSKRRWTVSERS
ncbi:hypothetical protein C8A05DRAFT_30514 [Staphylotrichum tortipilum]|uniref:Phosphoglycerate mutase n=1 Tax=Staphylotrichum tortipilum TaxID=2831512 RepID=A0AAN6MRD5_9PEZI|nr:hypothetical protein C8A05DRAFT_30514 [Staphylotrichum longicolle]